MFSDNSSVQQYSYICNSYVSIDHLEEFFNIYLNSYYVNKHYLESLKTNTKLLNKTTTTESLEVNNQSHEHILHFAIKPIRSQYAVYIFLFRSIANSMNFRESYLPVLELEFRNCF